MKICIAHFRAGLTDGVSLQIDERVDILKRMGNDVVIIADDESPIADLKINYLDYKNNPKIKHIQSYAFRENNRQKTKILGDLNEINLVADKIEKKLEDYWQKNPFKLIFIHNIFSLPVCLPATIAFYNFIVKHPSINAVAVHHDFYWDPPRKNLFVPANTHIKHLLSEFFPPKLTNLKHTVLNKVEKDILQKTKGIDSQIIHDTFDFGMKQWSKDPTSKDFLKDAGLSKNDFIILLASRIRRRKGIELGIEFTAAVDKLIKDGDNKFKTKYQRAVLLLPNEYSREEAKYIKKLKKKAADLGVVIRWFQEGVGSEEEKKKGLKKYSLWDSYVWADAVVYPSLWEGFGNQFLEAVFAKKPIVVFEYDVYKTDIKPSRFKVISLGDNYQTSKGGLANIKPKKISDAAYQLLELYKDKKKLAETCDENFEIGKKSYNTRVQLKKYLSSKSQKYIITNGIKSVISPLLLSGKLTASGVPMQSSYNKAESIIENITEDTITSEDFFIAVAKQLSEKARERYVVLEIVKEFLLSKKCKSPLFIFLGGLAGKTTMSNFIIEHLNLDQPTAIDKEKYRIAKPGESDAYLWKATYESRRGYVKTVQAMHPHLIEMIDRSLFDYKRYKKWCYFWEGIYLSGELVKKLYETHRNIYHLSIFLLPDISDIEKQYVLRWQRELGVEKLKKRKNIIDRYLKNVGAIRSHIAKNLDPIASYVIESSFLEERLSIFYAILYRKLKDIADKELPGWVERISEKPELIKKFYQFIDHN